MKNKSEKKKTTNEKELEKQNGLKKKRMKN